MAKRNEPHTQQTMFDAERPATRDSGPVTCLGMTFPNDEERRKHFLGILGEKLKDPEFRKIEGFPIGSDEDILALSDPPYYTACPNPFIEDFIRCYGKPYDPSKPYSREPFAVDVSEGKTDPIYKAHSYHTKVPHLAIVPSILHYTEPGDLVLDGFCGSGMTGVAAQWCGAAPEDYRHKIEWEFERQGLDKPKWGPRRVVLNDLSPAATFIAANYNLPFDLREFARAGRQILKDVEEELGWMYQTLHVEPASSRLIAAVDFEPCDPFHAAAATYHRDHLPHIQVAGATYFITFRTEKFRILSPAARSIALNAILHWDRQRWTVMSAVVMPDHVHLIAKPLPRDSLEDATWDLANILHSVKSFSANEINKLEGKGGVPVWQTERYDRIIRDDRELVCELAYMNHNPVKAGLAAKAEDYQWRYVAPALEKAGWKPAPLGEIEYTVWSEVFTCPDCAGEVVFLDEALDKKSKRVKDSFPCPHCGSELTKQRMDRLYETKFDPELKDTIRVPKRKACLIAYVASGTRYEKVPDSHDMDVLERIANMPLPAEVPTTEIPPMHMTHERARMDRSGVTHIHHFFLPRAAHSLAALWRKANAHPDPRTRHMLLFFVEQAIWGMSVLNRYQPIQHGRPGGSQVNRQLTGVYYVASQHAEVSPWCNLQNKLDRLAKAFSAGYATEGSAVICTGNAAQTDLADNSIDYIFTDPPFGENIYYADLNFLVEAWHRVFTNAIPEAIIDKFKKKGLPEYQHLMQRCFAEYYRVLKPGRWMTVVFHNSRNAVWNAIQEALLAAGFVVADVRTMDKQQGSYRQVTSSAVKQDLVISAYKPNEGLEERFELEAGTEEGVWDFIRAHLKQLPVFVSKDGQAEVIAERQNYLLFDRMVAFHVLREKMVPLSAAEFYEGLVRRFPERDGMYFLPEQAIEYDKKRMTVREILQLEIFVIDESSAIQWLKQQLIQKPQTFQEIHPQFLREIGGWQKHERPLELSEMLEQNFLSYDGKGEVPSRIHSYLSSNFKELRNLTKDDPGLKSKAKDRWYVPDPNKASDLQKLRERTLLREFEGYCESKQQRLKVFRLEAVRAGFRKLWQERTDEAYRVIIEVARKIPENLLQEDHQLLMWYDQALTRTE